MRDMEDFVDETLKEFFVNKKRFLYKPTTAEQENEWMDEYYEIDEEKERFVVKKAILNKCKSRNLVGVPWSKETIKKLIGVDKEWSSLIHEKKWLVLGKLKPRVFNKIILGMNKVDSAETKEKKNLSTQSKAVTPKSVLVDSTEKRRTCSKSTSSLPKESVQENSTETL